MPERWTITRAEFDGWSERTMRSLRWSSMVYWIAGGALAAVFSTLAWSAGSLRMRILVALVGLWGVSSVVGLVITQRRTRRLAEAADRIWALEGAVCPRCLATLGETPCRDGLTAADTDALRADWEATVRGDATGWIRMHALVGRRSRARSPLALWRWFRERVATAPFDPDRPLWLRFAAAIVGFGTPLALFMALLGGASSGTVSPRTFVGSLLQFGLGIGGMMIATTAWSGVRAGANRCSGCGQLVAPGAERGRCAECGAELAAAGAVISHEKRRDARTAAVAGSLAVAGFFAPILLSTTLVISALPTSVLLLQYRLSSPHVRYGIMLELSSRSLDAATTAAVADTLIACASTAPGPALLDSDFIGNALASGRLGDETASRALRATVDVRIDAPGRVRAGEPFEVRVVPAFGTDLLQMTHTALVAWRGVEADGAIVAAPASFFSRGAVDPTRSVFAPPEAVAVILQEPGEHRLRVRAWVIAVPDTGMMPRTAVFDDDGRLVPPDGAVGVSEIVIEKAVTVE